MSASNPALSIRCLRAGEAALLKVIRISALLDSPAQFGETLAMIADRTDPQWQTMLESMTPPSNQAMFILEKDGQAVGSAFALQDSLKRESGRIGGMWIDPDVRGSGGGKALAEAVKDWWRALGKTSVRLWVAEENSVAQSLYLKCAFLPTGNRKAFSECDSRLLLEMECRLSEA
jgi:GNAT superfamily N-acetyltransferase